MEPDTLVTCPHPLGRRPIASPGLCYWDRLNLRLRQPWPRAVLGGSHLSCYLASRQSRDRRDLRRASLLSKGLPSRQNARRPWPILVTMKKAYAARVSDTSRFGWSWRQPQCPAEKSAKLQATPIQRLHRPPCQKAASGVSRCPEAFDTWFCHPFSAWTHIKPSCRTHGNTLMISIHSPPSPARPRKHCADSPWFCSSSLRTGSSLSRHRFPLKTG